MVQLVLAAPFQSDESHLNTSFSTPRSLSSQVRTPQLDPLFNGLPPNEGQSAVDFHLDQFQQGISSFSPWGIHQGGTSPLLVVAMHWRQRFDLLVTETCLVPSQTRMTVTRHAHPPGTGPWPGLQVRLSANPWFCGSRGTILTPIPKALSTVPLKELKRTCVKRPRRLCSN